MNEREALEDIKSAIARNMKKVPLIQTSQPFLGHAVELLEFVNADSNSGLSCFKMGVLFERCKLELVEIEKRKDVDLRRKSKDEAIFARLQDVIVGRIRKSSETLTDRHIAQLITGEDLDAGRPEDVRKRLPILKKSEISPYIHLILDPQLMNAWGDCWNGNVPDDWSVFDAWEYNAFPFLSEIKIDEQGRLEKFVLDNISLDKFDPSKVFGRMISLLRPIS